MIVPAGSLPLASCCGLMLYPPWAAVAWAALTCWLAKLGSGGPALTVRPTGLVLGHSVPATGLVLMTTPAAIVVEVTWVAARGVSPFCRSSAWAWASGTPVTGGTWMRTGPRDRMKVTVEPSLAVAPPRGTVRMTWLRGAVLDREAQPVHLAAGQAGRHARDLGHGGVPPGRQPPGGQAGDQHQCQRAQDVEQPAAEQQPLQRGLAVARRAGHQPTPVVVAETGHEGARGHDHRVVGAVRAGVPAAGLAPEPEAAGGVPLVGGAVVGQVARGQGRAQVGLLERARLRRGVLTAPGRVLAALRPVLAGSVLAGPVLARRVLARGGLGAAGVLAAGDRQRHA